MQKDKTIGSAMTKFFPHFFSGIITIICLSLLFYKCASHLVTHKPAVIEVKHQKILLLPIRGLDILKSSEYWPDESKHGKLLLDNIQQIWNNLLAEFRRCEKYGLYTMVDSTASSTVLISLEIISSKLKNDTLFIPLKLKILYKSNKMSYTSTIDAYGLCASDTTITVHLQILGAAFADYRRRFPYEKTVSSFYTREVEK